MKITDVVPSKYSDFLAYCADNNLVFIGDLSGQDYLKFQGYTSKPWVYTQEIIQCIKDFAYWQDPLESDISFTESLDIECPIRKKEIWDQYDIALLIEAYWKIVNRIGSKEEIIHDLSFNIRLKAIHGGLDIDNSYCNEEEIDYNLASISYIFTSNHFVGHEDDNFYQIADMYLHNRSEFDGILKKAYDLVFKKKSKNKGVKRNIGIDNLQEEQVNTIGGLKNPDVSNSTFILNEGNDLEESPIDEQIIKQKGDDMDENPISDKITEKSVSIKNAKFDTSISLADYFNVVPKFFADASVDILFFSNRTKNCLKRGNIRTIEELLLLSIDDIKSMWSMGSRSIDEILEKVSKYVSDPENVNRSYKVSSNETKSYKIVLDENTQVVINNLFAGEPYCNDALTDIQIDCIEKVKNIIDLLGPDVCESFLENHDYWATINNAFENYFNSFYAHKKIVNDLLDNLNNIPSELRGINLKAILYAYNHSFTKHIDELTNYCSDNDTVNDLGRIIEKVFISNQNDDLLMPIHNLISWLCFDINDLIKALDNSIINALTAKGSMLLDVFNLRVREHLTLEEIGSRFGNTRERVRQLEKKCFDRLNGLFLSQKYNVVLLVAALNNDDGFLYYDEIKSYLGHITDYVWETAKRYNDQSGYYFSNYLNALVLKTLKYDESVQKEVDNQVAELIKNLPPVMLIIDKEAILSQFAKDLNISYEVLDNAFESEYGITGKFYNKRKINIGYMVDFVLKQCFPSGFKIADSFESNRFRNYMKDWFGDNVSQMTDRALDAKVGEVGVLCDRGKYIHPDYVSVDKEILDIIYDYIESSSRLVLPYGEIFENLKDVLVGAGISNRYYLQGVIKKYGCKYTADRDTIRKDSSVSLVDEFEQFVEERGIVHKSEIISEFTSINDQTLGLLIGRSKNVLNIDKGYYIHASQFDIKPEDYEPLRVILNRECKDIPVSIRKLDEAIQIDVPDFYYRNEFNDINKLFAALNYMFREEFSFSRPYIGKLGLKDITNRSVILQHIKDYDIIDINELIDICEENKILYPSVSYLCQSLAPDYIRKDSNSLIKYELTGINNEIIDAAVAMVAQKLEFQDYVSGGKVTGFIWLPQIDIDWNVYVLESIILLSKKINVVYMTGDPLKHPNAIYVSEKYKNDNIDSFLIKVLTDEVRRGSFMSKIEMRDWLKEEGLIETGLPSFLEGAQYFYVDSLGVHCTKDKD